MNCYFQRSAEDRTNKVDYAMPADFCQVFDDHLDSLYALALLLTEDHHTAERCFVEGLEDCLQGNPVFCEWAQSWAKRTVIKNAIRMISPLPNETETATASHESPFSGTGSPAAAIARLRPFDRFVYVLSVLEKYPDRECAILLNCAVEEVVNARIRALRRLASSGSRKGPAETVLTRVAGGLNQLYGEVL